MAVGEALQCPTLLRNGFGGHRIEGIGDKHVPWIHNVRNTDMVIALDDEHSIRLTRLFNEPVGREYLVDEGLPNDFVAKLDLLGISGIANMLGAIKFAKFYELDENDYVMTVFTDSMELYGSRLRELCEKQGEYCREQAARDYEILMSQTTDNVLELGYYDRKRIHNLKYYTWIEQQKKELAELNDQWFDREYWENYHQLASKYDELIQEFNDRVGLL